MSTYLDAKEALNVAVSCFANYNTPDNPQSVNLLTWLTNPKHRDKVEAIRSLPGKAERDEIKATLPAITPSGLFLYRRSADLVEHSGWLQFDIDLQDNARIRNYADLKAQICNLPFVGYCGLSVSGTGYWGLVPITYPERHGQHFDALKRVFAHYGINLDDKPRNVASLRGYSFDPDGWFAEQVMLFELYDEPLLPPVRPFQATADTDTERVRVEVCLSELTRRGLYLTDDYGEWYAIGCGLANAFGESGRDYFHTISQYHPSKYQPAATDRQFTACLKAGSQATLGTFFHLCRQVGVEWKELLPFPSVDQSALSRPVGVAQPNAHYVDPSNTYPSLVPSPRKAQFAQLLGVHPNQLALYQFKLSQS